MNEKRTLYCGFSRCGSYIKNGRDLFGMARCQRFLRICFNSELSLSYPMAQSSGEPRSSLLICLEKLMSEVLGKECKHHIRALGIRDELSP